MQAGNRVGIRSDMCGQESLKIVVGISSLPNVLFSAPRIESETSMKVCLEKGRDILATVGELRGMSSVFNRLQSKFLARISVLVSRLMAGESVGKSELAKRGVLKALLDLFH